VDTRISFTCGACGALYDGVTWSRLPLFGRIGACEVRKLILRWPDGMCVEVRRCGGCAGLIAAKRAQPDAAR
jgi:hypothetical protein